MNVSADEYKMVLFFSLKLLFIFYLDRTKKKFKFVTKFSNKMFSVLKYIFSRDCLSSKRSKSLYQNDIRKYQKYHNTHNVTFAVIIIKYTYNKIVYVSVCCTFDSFKFNTKIREKPCNCERLSFFLL